MSFVGRLWVRRGSEGSLGAKVASAFRLHEVVDGVHAAIAVPGEGAQGNAAIVDMGDRTLVFDTLVTPAAGEALAGDAERLTGRRAALVVNSHWHADHVLGNQAFAGAEIIATPTTRELMEGHRIAELLPPQVEAMGRLVAEETDPATKASLAATLAEGRRLLAALPTLRRTFPTVLFERHLTLRGSGRRADLLCLGGGHTRSDAFLHLPDDGVLITGDLVMVGVMPLLSHGDAAGWRQILASVRSLGAQRIIPGHGPVGGPEDLDRTDGYLAWVTELAAADPEAAPRVALPARFAGWRSAHLHAANLRSLLPPRP